MWRLGGCEITQPGEASELVQESACSLGQLGSIPGLGRSPGGGEGNPLQYSCWENPWTEEPGELQPMGSQRVEHNLESEHAQSFSSHLSCQVNCHGIIVLVFK